MSANGFSWFYLIAAVAVSCLSYTEPLGTSKSYMLWVTVLGMILVSQLCRIEQSIDDLGVVVNGKRD